MNSILDIAGIVALISGSISLLGVALNSYFNYKENQTNRYVQLITNQTLQNNLFIRNNSEIITVFTRPEIIDDARVRCDEEYKLKLMTAEVNIEHHFKYAIQPEKLMMEVLRELVKCAFQYFDSPTDELNTELRRLGEEYYELMTIYDYADWLYIKSQAKSKAYNKQFLNFNTIYEEVKKLIMILKKVTFLCLGNFCIKIDNLNISVRVSILPQFSNEIKYKYLIKVRKNNSNSAMIVEFKYDKSAEGAIEQINII